MAVVCGQCVKLQLQHERRWSTRFGVSVMPSECARVRQRVPGRCRKSGHHAVHDLELVTGTSESGVASVHDHRRTLANVAQFEPHLELACSRSCTASDLSKCLTSSPRDIRTIARYLHTKHLFHCTKHVRGSSRFHSPPPKKKKNCNLPVGETMPGQH